MRKNWRTILFAINENRHIDVRSKLPFEDDQKEDEITDGLDRHPGRAFDKIELDIVEQLPPTQRNKRYILTIQDHYVFPDDSSGKRQRDKNGRHPKNRPHGLGNKFY